VKRELREVVKQPTLWLDLAVHEKHLTAHNAPMHIEICQKNYLKLGNNYGIGYRSRVQVRYRVRVRGYQDFSLPGIFAHRSESSQWELSLQGAKIPESEKSLNRVRVVHNCTVYVGLLSLRYRTATYNTNAYDKLS